MAASTQSTLENIERRRAQLQENVEKLQKALTHWTTWEAEYQMLQEELEAAQDTTPEQIRDVARSLESKLIDEKEVEELLGKDLKTKRNANQVIDLISRRIDYVQKNSATIEHQLDNAEKQLAGVDVLLEPGVENEEGLPMMDIEEELDEEGNEMSSSVNQTGKNAAELIEVLRKAGLQKSELANTTTDTTAGEASSAAALSPMDKNIAATALQTEQREGNSTEEQIQISPKKVAFVEDTKPAASVDMSNFGKEGYNDALTDVNWTSGTKIIELDEDDNEMASYPLIPQGESPEDAELRRQMLQYGLSEVGQIVAELDLDHPVVEYDDDEDEDDYEYDTEDDEEDEYGRSTRSAITDDYRQQMMNLEKKLNARMMENVGPGSDANNLAEHAGDIRTMRIRKDEDFDKTLNVVADEIDKPESKKKGVRFADDLDISEPSRPTPQGLAVVQATRSASTISNKIVERSEPVLETPITPAKPAKVSRFKSARTANAGPKFLPTIAMTQPSPMPTGPSGRTLATKVVEHETSTAEPNVPDEFDPVLLSRQIQTEYHKARNRFIQQQGGFNKPSDDDDQPPIIEEQDGKTKKVSRFMAARLKADGM